MADQSGKVAWITGASSGIGEGLAKAFVADGGAVILSGRKVAELERVASESGAAERCHILPFETTDFAALPELAKQAIAWKGQVDILVNNAGISQRSLAVNTDFSVYQKIIDVDLLAPIALTQALLSHLVGLDKAAVINISSVAGKIGAPLRTAYSAAKHGIIGYGDSLRTEVAGQGVQVLNVAPGSVKTDVSRNALNADGSRRGQSDDAIENGISPKKCAEIIWQALNDGKREVVVAEGPEATMPQMRAAESDKFFDLMEQMIAGGYAKELID